MQAERVTVLIGSPTDAFEIPYDLLAQYSREFMKPRNALNDSGDEIAISDIGKSIFEDFFIWLHDCKPSRLRAGGNGSDFIDGTLNLAVVAQKHKAYYLRHQASDDTRDFRKLPDEVNDESPIRKTGSEFCADEEAAAAVCLLYEDVQNSDIQ
jgi:hypothetical protein